MRIAEVERAEEEALNVARREELKAASARKCADNPEAGSSHRSH
jgi:hypothetical protein